MRQGVCTAAAVRWQACAAAQPAATCPPHPAAAPLRPPRCLTRQISMPRELAGAAPGSSSAPCPPASSLNSGANRMTARQAGRRALWAAAAAATRPRSAHPRCRARCRAWLPTQTQPEVLGTSCLTCEQALQPRQQHQRRAQAQECGGAALRQQQDEGRPGEEQGQPQDVGGAQGTAHAVGGTKVAP